MWSFNLVLFSIFVGLSGDSFLNIWLMMEVNMAAFLLFLFNSLEKTSGVSKYFIAQSSGSLLFIFSSVTLSFQGSGQHMSLFLSSALVLKLGIAPLHWWLIRLFEELGSKSILILASVQKILPLYLLFKSLSMGSLTGLIILNGSLGAIMMTSQKKTRLVLAYFSLVSSGWLLSGSESISMALLYLTVFTLTLWLWLMASFNLGSPNSLMNSVRSKSQRLSLSVATLAFVGMPPLISFFLKLLLFWASVQSGAGFVVLSLLMLTPLILYTFLTLSAKGWKLRSTSSWESFLTDINWWGVFIVGLLSVSGVCFLLLSSKCA